MKKLIKFPKKIVDFFKGVFRELKLVEFPSKKETISMSSNVIWISVLLSVILIALDSLFLYVRNYLTTT